jgi:hypothetical protein
MVEFPSDQLCANWVMGELRLGVENRSPPPYLTQLGKLLHQRKDRTFSRKIAKEILKQMWIGQ